ncbi:hypothetical protein NQD34_006155 [Periophthalmus magnuspinnatus]|nr:hypothetical protein NQD34_006155 [Periophthalmus magnuspinnatus]
MLVGLVVAVAVVVLGCARARKAVDLRREARGVCGGDTWDPPSSCSSLLPLPCSGRRMEHGHGAHRPRANQGGIVRARLGLTAPGAFEPGGEASLFVQHNANTSDHMLFSLPPAGHKAKSHHQLQINTSPHDLGLLLIHKNPNFQNVKVNHTLYFVNDVDRNVTKAVNIIFLLTKYHVHCCKWRDSCFNIL